MGNRSSLLEFLTVKNRPKEGCAIYRKDVALSQIESAGLILKSPGSIPQYGILPVFFNLIRPDLPLSLKITIPKEILIENPVFKRLGSWIIRASKKRA